MKLFKNLPILLVGLGAASLLLACEGETPSTNTDASDTSGTTDTRDATSTPDSTTTSNPDATTPLDTTPNTPDIETPTGSVKAVQAESEALGCNPDGIVNVNESVTLTGVVVTSPKFDAFTPAEGSSSEALDGYYVADQDGGTFSGVYVSIPRANATNYLPGQVLDLAGESLEYYCNTQFKATTVTEQGTVTAPAPLALQPSDVGEAYEGMIVKLANVTVLEALQGGTYKITGDLIVDHDFPFFLSMTVGQSYDVTGAVVWSFGAWRIMPRTSADVVKLGGGTASGIVDIESSEASTGCTQTGTVNVASDLDITAVVSSPRFDASTNLHGYYLSDGTQDPYSGILMTIGKSQNTNFAVGTNLAVNGRHVEYYCMTELASTTTTALETTELSAPAALVIDANLSNADFEKYEGMLVTIEDVTVTAVTDHAESDTDAGVLIDKDVIGAANWTAPAVGSEFSSITGYLHWNFDRYRVAPRSTADLVAK
ncbi:MAG: hypothetical protein KC635_04965 [Myxococcales bacterium]|nr:hypothetical protein [Myxococcales bacterium]MCB9732319.1 hypothetical protein [Deltaproteobacteria bacterium]